MDNRKRYLIPGMVMILVLGAAVVISRSNWLLVQWNNWRFCTEVRKLEERDEGSKVSLRSLTPFSWDYVYTFDPYTSKKEMEEILGFSDPNLAETVNEGMVQLVFVKQQKVVADICGYAENLGFSVNFGSWNLEEHYQKVSSDLCDFSLDFEPGYPRLTLEGEMFEGTVLSFSDPEFYEALIEIDEGYPICSSGNRVTVWVPEEISIHAGDRVRVRYNGLIAEIFPLQIHGQVNVEVLLEDGEKKHTDQAAETKEAVESTDAPEIYYLKTEDEILPEIILNKEYQTFSLSYNVLSSYLGTGTYEQTDAELILQTEDGNYRYVFDILEDGTLRFREKDSSDIHVIYKHIGPEIKDGAEFEPVGS